MFIVNAQASSPYQPQCPTGFQEHSLQDPSLPPFSLVLSPSAAAAKYIMNVIIIIKIMMVLPFWWHITQKEIKIRKPVSSSVHNLYLQSWPCSVSDLEEDLRAASAFLSTKRSSSVFTDSLDDLSSRLMMILLMMYAYKILYVCLSETSEKCQVCTHIIYIHYSLFRYNKFPLITNSITIPISVAPGIALSKSWVFFVIKFVSQLCQQCQII